MNRIVRSAFLLVIILGTSGAAGRASAQTPVAAPRNVVSANPFGLLLELFNAEFERAISDYSTIGIGGSSYFGGDEDYVNGDVFFRYYPGGEAFDGWAFGVKTGVTDIDEEGAYFGLGFDLNRSWLLGAKDNFYVGAGFGLKRLYGTGSRELDLEVIPTIRIVNVGFAF